MHASNIIIKSKQKEVNITVNEDDKQKVFTFDQSGKKGFDMGLDINGSEKDEESNSELAGSFG